MNTLCKLTNWLCAILLIYLAYDVVDTIVFFGLNHAGSILLGSMDSFVMVFLVIFFSLKKNPYYMFMTILFFLIWSHYFDAPSLDIWVRYTFPKQIIHPQSFPALLSGLGAGIFVLIVLLTLFLVVLDLKRKFYKKSGY